MDSESIVRVLTVVLGAVLGIAAKFIYDRRFAKHPDLRFAVGGPASFKTAEGERVYQNIEIVNVGSETANNVRVNFDRIGFARAEHQIVYDGPHSLETVDDRVSVVVENLPPGDFLTVSFLIRPSDLVSVVQDLFVSAKSKECIAKQIDRSRSRSDMSTWSILTMVMLLLAMILAHVYQRLETARLRHELSISNNKLSEGESQLRKMQKQ